MNALVIPSLAEQLPALPDADIDRAASYAKQDKAPATREAYRADFAAFQAFCRSRGVASLPATAETVAVYLATEAEAGLKPSTINRRSAAIRYAHKLAGHEPPTNSETVKATLRGIHRTLGAAPARKAWTPARLLAEAEKIGASTAALCEAIMRAKPHPEQGFRSCLGILRMEKTYGAQRLEAACRRGVAIGAASYRSIASILKTGLDKAFLPETNAEADPIRHGNIRGRGYYH